MKMRRVIIALFLLVPGIFGGESQALRKTPAREAQDRTGVDWKRFLKVDRWLLEYHARCDDQYSWHGGLWNKHWSCEESMDASFEVTNAAPGNPRWRGVGEAKLKSSFFNRTDWTNREYGWDKNEGGGTLKITAELDFDEMGYKFRFYNGKEIVEGSHTGESYNLRAGKWVLDKRNTPCRIVPPPYFLNGPPGPLAFPQKGLVLSGSKAFPIDNCRERDRERGGVEHPHAGSWRWRIIPLGTDIVDVVIDPPEGYRDWLPIAGASETQAGRQMEVKARLVSRDGKPPRRKAKKFIFELDNVSAEPGICMNYPIEGATSSPDLAFEPGVSRLLVSSPLSLRGETVLGEHLSATAVVSCFDYGASGDLKVTAEMEDGELIEGYVRDEPSRTYLPIPYREGGSRIAWTWLSQAGALGLGDADDSEDDPVGDGFRGDGLTLYEEYRGFMERSGHGRADPKKKELFVANRLGREADSGITLFEKASGMKVRVLTPEIHPDREINFNRSKDSPFRCRQHLVILGRGDLADQVHVEYKDGVTCTESRRKKITPVSVQHVAIFANPKTLVMAIGAEFHEQEAKKWDITIAHELLHCVGVLHHGEGDIIPARWTRQENPLHVTEDGKRIEVFTEGPSSVSVEASESRFDKPENVMVAVQNGRFSGDQRCLMRYAEADAYVYPNNRSPKRYLVPQIARLPELWGLGLCSSPNGTGVNAPDHSPWPRYGKATHGRCAQQIRVSDADP